MSSECEETLRFGALTLRDRLVMAPMVTLFPEVADRPTDRHAAFYERRARGGVGLVLVGAVYVAPDGKGFPNQMGIDSDAKVPAFRRLAARIQRYAPAVVQLFHAGPKTSRTMTGCDVVGPSVSAAGGGRHDRADSLSGAAIDRIVAAFEAAALRACHAGFAGVEIHGANGYLVHAFSDGRMNRRADGWRGLDALPAALVHRLRACLPAKCLVGYTLSPFAIGSHDVADADALEWFVDLGTKLVAAGVDYIHVYRGKSERWNGEEPRVFAGMLRRAGLTLPIVEGAGIRSRAHAERFLREGATLAAVGRALIARPELPSDANLEVSEAELAALSTAEGLREAFVSEYRAGALASREPQR